VPGYAMTAAFACQQNLTLSSLAVN